MANQPLKRDILAEAFAIANGLQGAPPPRKDHIQALAKQLVAYAETFKRLQGSLTKLFQEATKQAQSTGKPLPEFPQVLREQEFISKLKEINEGILNPEEKKP